MTGLTFKLRAPPEERLDLSPFLPGALAALSLGEIERLPVGTSRRGLKVGDVFAITGAAGDTLAIEGGSNRLDFVGANNGGGTIVVEGDVGAYAGHAMSGGRLEIRGNAGPWLASGFKGGLVTVSRNAGDFLGGPRAGERFGMMGGVVIVSAAVGERAGERMRRGTVIVKGGCGALAGARMVGGTIWAESGFGDTPGVLMRRGTLIGPTVGRLLATFVDCGRHDLGVLRIMSRHLAATLGPLAPKPIGGAVRKLAGDMATIGRGEILLLE